MKPILRVFAALLLATVSVPPEEPTAVAVTMPGDPVEGTWTATIVGTQIADQADAIAAKVTFNKTSIKVGYSTLVDMSFPITATVAPKAARSHIGFVVPDHCSGLTVSPDGDETEGETSVTVPLVLRDGIASEEEEDKSVEARIDQDPDRVAGSIKVTCVIPKTQEQSVGALVFTNGAIPDGESTTTFRPTTNCYRVVTITVKDQFGDTLDPIYDGQNVVTESFSDTHGDGYRIFPSQATIVFPDANFAGGVKLDRCGCYQWRAGYALPNGALTAWVAFQQMIPPPPGYNNAVGELIAEDGRDYAGDALQAIQVHGHSVTPSYRRTGFLRRSNHPTAPFDFSQQPEGGDD